jgi:D-alanyl-D-alanine endopeptidase (penicillin-binding protein 7)
MSKGFVVVDQKFKLRWLVSALISLLALSSITAVEAASSRQKSARQATELKASAKAKVKASKSARKGVTAAKAAKRLKKPVAKVSTRVRATKLSRASSARRGTIVRTMATSEPLITRPARIVPVSTHATATGSSGRMVIASPAVSSASGASFGQIYGLHQTPDPLELHSSVAFVMDQDTNEVLLSKNSDAVLPIASLTKLMTATVVVEGRLSMDEVITVTDADVDTEKNSSSRLAVGTTLTRGEALHLALMSSENRAAHALGRTYPGGMGAFVAAMNAKARQLGMLDTHYTEPTGLSSKNQSSAKDLAALVKAAYQMTIIRELSTSTGYALNTGTRQVQFRNTNSLVKNPTWDIGLQKTGYIVEAGRCLVMQARMAGRKLIMVFLDSTGKYSRLGDAERVRRWIETAGRHSGPSAAMVPSKSTS